MKKENKGLLKSITSIFTYSPPKYENKFELLEPENEGSYESSSPNTSQSLENQQSISKSLKENFDTLSRELGFPQNGDIRIKEFRIAKRTRALVAYNDSMVDNNIISQFILKPLLNEENFKYRNPDEDIITYISEGVLPVNLLSVRENFADIVDDIVTGNTAIFIENENKCLSLETQGFEKRSVEKTTVENVIIGPQEGFTEDLKTNLGLIRKIVKNKNLMTEFFVSPSRERTRVSILYLKDLADPELVEEVRRRITNIKPALLLGTGILEQLIEDNPLMVFPQVLHTERPDRAASCILEGKVVIVESGSPFVLTVPSDIVSLIHSSEDSYLRWYYGSAVRLIRLLGYYIALLLPGLYISLVTFHQEVIPTDLLVSIGVAKESVPFPSVVEVLIMELSFELIREASVRVPSQIGNTLGIVGAIILGQAAVAANLVSPILIIIASVSGLGNFAIPSFSLATGVRILKFVFIFLGSLLGFVGISIGLVLMTGLLSYMKSFGVPFLSSKFASKRRSHDLIFKFPVWKQEFRPDTFQAQDNIRQPHIARKWAHEKPKNKGDE